MTVIKYFYRYAQLLENTQTVKMWFQGTNLWVGYYFCNYFKLQPSDSSQHSSKVRPILENMKLCFAYNLYDNTCLAVINGDIIRSKEFCPLNDKKQTSLLLILIAELKNSSGDSSFSIDWFLRGIPIYQ